MSTPLYIESSRHKYGVKAAIFDELLKRTKTQMKTVSQYHCRYYTDDAETEAEYHYTQYNSFQTTAGSSQISFSMKMQYSAPSHHSAHCEESLCPLIFESLKKRLGEEIFSRFAASEQHIISIIDCDPMDHECFICQALITYPPGRSREGKAPRFYQRYYSGKYGGSPCSFKASFRSFWYSSPFFPPM